MPTGACPARNRQFHVGLALGATSYSIHREDGDDLVPFGSLVWLETKLLRQTSREVINALANLQACVCLARQAASEWVVRVSERMATIHLIQHEVAYRNRVRRVQGELWHPCGSVERHTASYSRTDQLCAPLYEAPMHYSLCNCPSSIVRD
jgi:hypothetical protein